MSVKLPISAHILTFNSADTVERTLQSVQQCKEILVIDGGSTDATLEIAEKYGARVIPQRDIVDQGKPLEDFSAPRNEALKFTNQPWILSIDSDEEASQDLIDEAGEIATSEQEPAAYYVPRKYTLADGKVVEHATTYPNERLYFFHRDVISEWIKPVHERPRLNAHTPVKHLEGPTLAKLGTLEEFKEKNLRYLEIEMGKSKGKGWGHWLRHRLYHTFRSRLIALVKLLWIWLTPHRGKRLPLSHEMLRFWYGWQLILKTMPKNTKEKQ